MPAKAGIQNWVPACAGTSGSGGLNFQTARLRYASARQANAPPPVFFAAPGRPSSLPHSRGFFFSPQAKPEEVEHRVAHQSSVLPRSLLENAGASRRSTAAISDPRVRVSWCPFRFLRFGPQRQFASSACRALARPKLCGTVPVQRAPRGGVLVPPDRVPRPPGSGVTSPARRRRIPSRCQNVS
jgi:hypothetical protein